MIQVQMRIYVKKNGKITLHSDILAREDANKDELKLAEKIEHLFLDIGRKMMNDKNLFVKVANKGNRPEQERNLADDHN